MGLFCCNNANKLPQIIKIITTFVILTALMLMCKRGEDGPSSRLVALEGVHRSKAAQQHRPASDTVPILLGIRLPQMGTQPPPTVAPLGKLHVFHKMSNIAIKKLITIHAPHEVQQDFT